MSLRILHVLDHSLPLHSGYTFRTRAILHAQIGMGLEVRGITGLRHLAAGLALARQQGVMNFHGWLPRAMARLAARALDAGIETDYVRNLIQTRALPATEEARDLETGKWAGKDSNL